MTKNLMLGIAASMIIASCATKQGDVDSNDMQGTIAAPPVDTTAKKNTHQFDTLTVKERTVVIYSPDSAQIKKRIKSIGQEEFNTIEDDYKFYLGSAESYLTKKGLKTIDAKGKKVIKFVQSDNTISIVNITEQSHLWGMYFFDPSRKEKSVNVAMVDDEFKNYFK